MKLEEYTESKKYQNIKFEGYQGYIEIINSESTDCKFYNAIFQGLDLRGVKLDKCNLSNVQLTSHSYQDTTFDNCNLVRIDFSDSYLENVTFNNCNLLYANFNSTNL